MRHLLKDDGMEAIKLNPKKNVIDAYGLGPTLFYDVEGILVGKNGRDIKVEKTIDDKKITYSIRVRDEVKQLLGEKVLIQKENILSMKVEEKEEEKVNSIDPKEVLDSIGIEDSEENIKAIEYLLKNNIPITKDNIDTFFMSKKYLEDIIENIDFESCIKLMDKGIDFGEDSLQKIADALMEVKGEERGFSFKELIGLERRLSYKEAEAIANEIYGRKMGKDVYDSIIALHKENIPITKENIERLMEVVDKLHDLKDYEDETLIRFFKEDLPFNIDSLYRYKHSYNTRALERNILSPLYEQFALDKEDPLKYIMSLLKDLNLEAKGENIQLVREFLFNGVEVTREKIERFLDMKSKLKELIDITDHEKIAILVEEGVDILKEDIDLLIEKLRNIEGDKGVISTEKASDLLEKIKTLKTITDKELLQLIKRGEDFKIENLEEILSTQSTIEEPESKVIEKVKTISNIFNSLKDLSSNTIALTYRRFSTISLNNLYQSHLELDGEKHMVEPIAKAEENLIRESYLNIKTNTSLNLIKQSITEGVALEHMPLEELNQYVDKKVNRYREIQRLINEIRYLKGKEGLLVSTAMKGQLNMSINQLSNIDSLLHRGKGFGSMLNNFLNNRDSYGKEIEEKIEILEAKIKEFSSSLKKGRDEVKREYGDILDSFKDLSNLFNSHGRDRDGSFKQLEKYLSLQNHLSKDDLVIQLPIFSDGEYNNVNLIIPDINKGINKNNMVFYFNMNLNNLGEVRFELQVKDDKVYVDFMGERLEAIKENEELLKEGLKGIGYTLEEFKSNEEVK